MPVREANEPRERSDSEAIWSPDADFHRSEARIENRAYRIRVWDIVYRGLVTRLHRQIMGHFYQIFDVFYW